MLKWEYRLTHGCSSDQTKRSRILVGFKSLDKKRVVPSIPIGLTFPRIPFNQSKQKAVIVKNEGITKKRGVFHSCLQCTQGLQLKGILHPNTRLLTVTIYLIRTQISECFIQQNLNQYTEKKQFKELYSNFEQSWSMWTSWRLFNIIVIVSN